MLRKLAVGIGLVVLFGACSEPSGEGSADGSGSGSSLAGAGGDTSSDGGSTSAGGAAGEGSGGTSANGGSDGGSGGKGAGGGASGGDSSGGASTGGATGGSGSGGATGTLPAPAPDSGAPARLASAMSQCGALGTAAVVEALARGGIETRSIETDAILQEPSPPVRGLHVWDWQASAMACDLANGGGLSGQQLDDVVGPLPLPNGETMDFSMLVAAYVSLGGGSFGSELGAALMGPIDPSEHATLVYPNVVLTLFQREVLLPILASEPATAPLIRKSAAGDPCAAISEFLDDMPAAVAGATNELTPEEEGVGRTVVSAAASIFGFVAYVGAEAARQVIKHVPLRNAINAGMSAAQAIQDVRAMFTNWKLTVTANQDEVHKSVDGPNTGTLTLEVEQPEEGFDWPQPLRSCSELLDIPLPTFNGAEGATVEWIPQPDFPPLAEKVSGDGPIADSHADMTFKTVTEPEALHLEGLCEASKEVTVEAQMGLPGLESFANTLMGFFTNAGAARTVASASASQASKLLGPKALGKARITYHPTTAAVNFDSFNESVHLTSTNGVGPNSTWTGTWTMTIGQAALCGPAQTKPASFTMSGGSADLSLSFSTSGGFMSSCSLSFTETLTIEPDPFTGKGCILVSNGSYTGQMIPPDPEVPLPPPLGGIRDESYTIEYDDGSGP